MEKLICLHSVCSKGACGKKLSWYRCQKSVSEQIDITESSVLGNYNNYMLYSKFTLSGFLLFHLTAVNWHETITTWDMVIGNCLIAVLNCQHLHR